MFFFSAHGPQGRGLQGVAQTACIRNHALPHRRFVFRGLHRRAHEVKTNACHLPASFFAQGRVWLMVAGGGASVIYADTVGDLGFSAELGNYGEYSGAPNTQVRLHTVCMDRILANLALTCAIAHVWRAAW